jgi:hypothetical protein
MYAVLLLLSIHLSIRPKTSIHFILFPIIAILGLYWGYHLHTLIKPQLKYEAEKRQRYTAGLERLNPDEKTMYLWIGNYTENVYSPTFCPPQKLLKKIHGADIANLSAGGVYFKTLAHFKISNLWQEITDRNDIILIAPPNNPILNGLSQFMKEHYHKNIQYEKVYQDTILHLDGLKIREIK